MISDYYGTDFNRIILFSPEWFVNSDDYQVVFYLALDANHCPTFGLYLLKDVNEGGGIKLKPLSMV
mgnify:CR=1 FL=1